MGVRPSLAQTTDGGYSNRVSEGELGGRMLIRRVSMRVVIVLALLPLAAVGVWAVPASRLPHALGLVVCWGIIFAVAFLMGTSFMVLPNGIRTTGISGTYFVPFSSVRRASVAYHFARKAHVLEIDLANGTRHRIVGVSAGWFATADRLLALADQLNDAASRARQGMSAPGFKGRPGDPT